MFGFQVFVRVIEDVHIPEKLRESLKAMHGAKSVQIRSFFSPNVGKCGPEKNPYLDSFHAVMVIQMLVFASMYDFLVNTRH